jgi:hypothetical protein
MMIIMHLQCPTVLREILSILPSRLSYPSIMMT